jgi:hypothetical protein
VTSTTPIGVILRTSLPASLEFLIFFRLPAAHAARERYGSADDIERAKASAEGLGLFVRSLVGLGRAAAVRGLTSENGIMDAARLYESPYVDLSTLGVDGLFAPEAAGSSHRATDGQMRPTWGNAVGHPKTTTGPSLPTGPFLLDFQENSWRARRDSNS